ASSSVAARFRCDELQQLQQLDDLIASTSYSSSAAPHPLHHPHHTTAFKPAPAAYTTSSIAMANNNHRRRSLPVRTQRAVNAIVGGQLPARRRPAPDVKLNSAQHPHVAPIVDPKIQADDRTLQNLKDTERDSILVGPRYLESVQPELQAHHRTTVVEWMHDVLREDAADEEVFPLAVLILDNFLSQQAVLLRDVQGIASACMLMASKMKAPAPMNAARLAFFTENSVCPSQIVNWELLILRALKWQIALPTAFDFVDQVFCRAPALRPLRTHFVRALYDMQMNVREASFKPSMQAAVSLARSARVLGASGALLEQLRVALHAFLDFDLDMALRLSTAAVAGATASPARAAAAPAFDASSLAYTPVYEDSTLLQPVAAEVVAAAPRPKSPPVTPPSGTDSGFCSTQGTPESAD
ncbi:hypothetical protein PFISCL1PPCAC_8364, partial [Pristionchus fissidentatus]